jgi:hypothetical protein
VAGVGDFDGDSNDDLFWRNYSTGENYLYPMQGTVILAGEGYVRAVTDLSWDVAGVGDFDGDARSDILWRNAASGENYIYRMNGTAITAEGYIRAVTDLAWDVALLADFDGDGKTDIFWRNGATGENYLYPMDGLAIKPTEGFIRTISDLNWRVVYRSPWPEEMAFAMAGAESLVYTAETVADVRLAALPELQIEVQPMEAPLMLSESALSNVATFYGLQGTIELGSFDGRALPQGADPVTQALQSYAVTTAARQAEIVLDAPAEAADSDWLFVSSDDRATKQSKASSKVDWKSALSWFATPFLPKNKAAGRVPSHPNDFEFTVVDKVRR